MNLFFLVAAAAAGYFAIEAVKQARPGIIVAAALWSSYAAYEYLIATQVLCDAKCNIRVDLLLIWPLLLISTLYGIFPRGEWTATARVLRIVGVCIIALISILFIGLFVESS